MSGLDAMGIKVQRKYVGENTELVLTLPKARGIRASFTPEGLAKTITKFFSRELQTGDDAFDMTVYVKTDTPDQTAALLENASVRGVIARTVDAGGWIEIDDAS